MVDHPATVKNSIRAAGAEVIISSQSPPPTIVGVTVSMAGVTFIVGVALMSLCLSGLGVGMICWAWVGEWVGGWGAKVVLDLDLRLNLRSSNFKHLFKD